MLPKRKWQNRPFEIRNFLNPYFCAVLIWQTVDSYCIEKKSGMAFSLSFLILPLILNEDMCNELPKTKEANPLNWFDKINQETFIEMPSFCHNLAPYTREAVILGMQHQFLIINDKGLIKSNKYIEKLEGISVYRDKAKVLGHLFAKTTPETIFTKLKFIP